MAVSVARGTGGLEKPNYKKGEGGIDFFLIHAIMFFVNASKSK